MDLRPGRQGHAIENDYDKEVYNGDIGNIDCINAVDGELVANFDGRAVTYGFGELDMLVPALRRDDPQKPGFGISSRGHPDDDAALRDVAAEPSLHRGDSGKKLVVLVGQKKAVAIAVRKRLGPKTVVEAAEWLRPKAS